MPVVRSLLGSSFLNPGGEVEHEPLDNDQSKVLSKVQTLTETRRKVLRCRTTFQAGSGAATTCTACKPKLVILETERALPSEDRLTEPPG